MIDHIRSIAADHSVTDDFLGTLRSTRLSTTPDAAPSPPAPRRRRRLAALAIASLFALPLLTAAPARAATEDCGRTCLLSILTDFTEALTDNDLSRLKLADNLRATTNGVVTPLGKGEVWGQIKRIAYRQAFVDPKTGAAVFYGTLTNTPTRNAHKWWYYVVRLKVVDGRITEVQEIDYDGVMADKPASTLHLADRIWDTVLPPDERVSRARLFELANLYFDAVSHKVDYHAVPWHPECQRIELGTFTVNAAIQPGSCGGEFKNPKMKWNVVNRHSIIADEARGIVVASGNFTTPPEFPDNNGSVVIEVFKVQDGMIRYIEAFFRGNGQAKSGW